MKIIDLQMAFIMIVSVMGTNNDFFKVGTLTDDDNLEWFNHIFYPKILSNVDNTLYIYGEKKESQVFNRLMMVCLHVCNSIHLKTKIKLNF